MYEQCLLKKLLLHVNLQFSSKKLPVHVRAVFSGWIWSWDVEDLQNADIKHDNKLQ